ncbi:MAG TPA: hypothetical protein VHZ95_18955 [Polyangiales bacterium]|nr:hypothetical protein [Polyangiales bacterium]
MKILLGFTPFVAFMIAARFFDVIGGLIAGAIVASALVLRNLRAPKILEVGTLVVFVAITIYVFATHTTMSVIALRLCVDIGLFCVVLVSMLVRRPFTIQYAREQVPAEYWNSPQFLSINYMITAAWTAAFGVMVLAEAALLALPAMPPAFGFGAIIAAMAGAAVFTRVYPRRRH